MKRIVLGVVIAIVLLAVMLSTTVNAASLGTDKTKMEKGQIVTLTVTTDEEVESMQFDLKFDATKYKFVEDSITTDLRTVDYNVKGDVITVSAFDTNITTKTLSLKFEALENGENVPFEISGTEFSNDEAMSNASVEVTIADKEEPTKPTDPTDKEDSTDSTNPADKEEPTEPSTDDKKPSTGDKNTVVDNGDKYVDENGKEITKLPQAGSLVPSIVLGVAVLGLATITGYKMIKSK